tara:strand:+ start:90 stop:335 length:246 start_codon:yes stop_codon:yes gene_type:complete
LFEPREANLLVAIEDMAQKYGMLPTDIMQKATTVDFMIYYNANLIKIREDKRSRGENINDTYTQSEIDQVYSNFKKHQDGL